MIQKLRRKKIVGPHVLMKTGRYGRYFVNGEPCGPTRYWKCKYCGEESPMPYGPTFTIKSCDGIEWLESEKEAARSKNRTRLTD